MGTYYRSLMAQTFCRNAAVKVRVGSFEGGKLFRFEGTGRRIWELLEYPITVEEIARRLACEFTGDVAKVSGDTEGFLAALRERGLVETRSDAPSAEDRQRYRYLGLLKRALVNLLYPEHELRIHHLQKPDAGMSRLEQQRYLRDIRYRAPDAYQSMIDVKGTIGIKREHPYTFSHTMIGMAALHNIERCAEVVFGENIPGDFMEAGVCQGGAAIFMRAIQTAYGEEHRRLWAADSFEGIPAPQSRIDRESGLDLSEAVCPVLAFSLDGVRDNFLRYGMLDPEVVFLPGWFAETLPCAPIPQLAILRLDADIYASTWDALTHLYPNVSPGGFVIVDDYGAFAVCREAVEAYRTQHGIDEPIQFVTEHVVYWRKQA